MSDIDLKKTEGKMYDYVIGYNVTQSEKLLIQDFYNYLMNEIITGKCDKTE